MLGSDPSAEAGDCRECASEHRASADDADQPGFTDGPGTSTFRCAKMDRAKLSRPSPLFRVRQPLPPAT